MRKRLHTFFYYFLLAESERVKKIVKYGIQTFIVLIVNHILFCNNVLRTGYHGSAAIPGGLFSLYRLTAARYDASPG